jgi:hypothetical protein
MVIDNKYNFGDIVYLKTDKDQREGIVTCLKVTPHGVLYRLNFGTVEYDAYDVEISTEKNVMITTTN